MRVVILRHLVVSFAVSQAIVALLQRVAFFKSRMNRAKLLANQNKKLAAQQPPVALFRAAANLLMLAS
jgi:hypothetical protein